MRNRLLLCVICILFINNISIKSHDTINENNLELSLNKLFLIINKGIHYNKNYEIVLNKKLSKILYMQPRILIKSINIYNRLYPNKKLNITAVRYLLIGCIVENLNINWKVLNNFNKKYLHNYKKLGRNKLLKYYYIDAKSHFFGKDKYGNIIKTYYFGRSKFHYLNPFLFYKKWNIILSKNKKKFYNVYYYLFAEKLSGKTFNNFSYDFLEKNISSKFSYKFKKSDWLHLGHIINVVNNITLPCRVRNDHFLYPKSVYQSLTTSLIFRIRDQEKINSIFDYGFILERGVNGSAKLVKGKEKYIINKKKLNQYPFNMEKIVVNSAFRTSSLWFSPNTLFYVKYKGQKIVDPIKESKLQVIYFNKLYWLNHYTKDNYKRLLFVNFKDSEFIENWYKLYKNRSPSFHSRESVCRFLKKCLKNVSLDKNLPIYIKKDKNNEYYVFNLKDNGYKKVIEVATINDIDFILFHQWFVWAFRRSVFNTVKILHNYSKFIK